MQSENLALPIGQRKELRVARAPNFLGGVLHLGGIFVGHQFLYGGKRGEHVGAAVQFHLPLGAQILEGQLGIAGVLLDGLQNLFFGGVAHDQQGGESQSRNNRAITESRNFVRKRRFPDHCSGLPCARRECCQLLEVHAFPKQAEKDARRVAKGNGRGNGPDGTKVPPPAGGLKSPAPERAEAKWERGASHIVALCMKGSEGGREALILRANSGGRKRTFVTIRTWRGCLFSMRYSDF